jgi:hypothetical protein
MNPILLALIADLAPPLVELLIALLKDLTAQLGKHAATMAEVSTEIVSGIEHDWPDWTNEKKHDYASGAVLVAAKNLGVTVSESTVNSLIEMAVKVKS